MNGKPEMKPTMTIAEANSRAGTYANRARQDLLSNLPIEPGMSETQGDCSDPTDNGPTNRLLASRSYRVNGVDLTKMSQYFDAALQWWAENNFTILQDKSDGETRFVQVENREDAFRMTLESNYAGGLVLYATSPCVWPKGTPEPETSAYRTSPNATRDRR